MFETILSTISAIVASVVTYFVTKKQTEGRKVDSDTITLDNAERITSIYKTQIDDLTERLNHLEKEFLALKKSHLECNANCIELQHENDRLRNENNDLKDDYERLKSVCDKLSSAIEENKRLIQKK